MEKTDDFKRTDDRARLLTKLSVIGAIGSLILLMSVLVLASARGGDVLSLAAIPFALSLFFSLTSLIYSILFGAVQREDEEKRLLARRMEARALNVEEDVRFTAGRSFANYTRFAPFVIAGASAVIIGLMLWKNSAIWALREGAPVTMNGSPVHTALIAAVLMMVSVFAGAFMVGQSRMPGFRWLRPVGAWLMMGFLTLCAAAVSAVCYSNNLPKVDPVVTQVFFWVFVVLAIEFVTNSVIEFYRPRTLAESRPVFESQLLALFTEPGGVWRNIASALDYQFGFKVSGTWIYGFFERSFFPVLILWAVLIWGFTMVHEVGPNNVGIKERFGKVVSETVLEPGIYWTLPYPFGGINQFSCTEVKRLVIGENAESAKERANSPVVLWTNAHGGAKDPFIVAVKEPERNVAKVKKSAAKDELAVSSSSISFVNMAIPIEYRIRKDGVIQFAYGNVDPEAILKKLGEETVVEYLAGSTMDNLMSSGRGEAEAALKKNLQKLADQNSLGVEIIRVAIMDAHPPVEQVAPAYQNVIASIEEKDTEILRAKAYEYKVLPEAYARAYEIENASRSKAYSAQVVAAAESERFDKQLTAFRSMKEMFILNAMMDVLSAEGSSVRKFIVPENLKKQLYEVNLETNERLDLVNLDVSELNDKK